MHYNSTATVITQDLKVIRKFFLKHNKTGLYKLNGRSGRRHAGPYSSPGILHIRKNTQKSKFLLSQTFKWKENMFFVIPEMPSKTFVMLYKKLPDHFKCSRFKYLYKENTELVETAFLL